MSRKEFTMQERDLVSEVFQNYYHEGIYAIARESAIAKSLFLKIGLIGGGEELEDNEE